MRSTGEVMGIDRTFGLAFAKSQLAAGTRLPGSGTVFFSLAERDYATGVRAATGFARLGYVIVATAGTAAEFERAGIEVGQVVAKLNEPGTNAVELIADGKVDLVVNSPRGRGPRADGEYIRSEAGSHGVPLLTTAAAALAAANGLSDIRRHAQRVRPLQDYHRGSVDQLELPL
jgi:carbamoyl-phosphate synthase large subunit